jgi:hypothetical protein
MEEADKPIEELAGRVVAAVAPVAAFLEQKEKVKQALDDPKFVEFVFFACGPNGQTILGASTPYGMAMAAVALAKRAAESCGL